MLGVAVCTVNSSYFE